MMDNKYVLYYTDDVYFYGPDTQIEKYSQMPLTTIHSKLIIDLIDWISNTLQDLPRH